MNSRTYPANVKIRLISFFWFSIVAFTPLFGGNSGPENYSLRVSSWNQQDGLPDWRILSFLQDHNGLLWLSSMSGLHTFDGNEFRRVLPANLFNKTGNVQTIHEDGEHNIWIFRRVNNNQNIEIDIFHPETGVLQSLAEFYDLEASEIKVFKGIGFNSLSVGGRIWLAIRGEIYEFGSTIRKISSEDIEDPFDFFPADNGYWETNRGNTVFLRDYNGVVLDSFELEETPGEFKFYVDNKRRLFVFDGIVRDDFSYYELISSNGRIVGQHKINQPEPEWINSTIYDYPSGRILLSGLRFDSDGKSVYLNDIKGKFSFNLSQDFPELVNSFPFFFDKEGGIWCSNPKGLSRWTITRSDFFTNYLSKEAIIKSTRGMTLNKGKLLVASYAGARIVDLKDGSHIPFEFPKNKSAYCIEQIGDDLYIGKIGWDDPLIKINASGTITGYPYNELFNEVYDIFPVSQHKLWLGTSYGLVKFDTRNGKYSDPLLEGLSIFHIYENQLGFWLLSNKGLVLVDKEEKHIHTFLDSEVGFHYRRLTHLYEDPSGDFWIGTTGAGLIHFDVANGKVKKVIDVYNGLSHNNVHAVYPDKSGKLWLSSDNGLMRLDRKTYEVEVFFEEDGVSSNEFNFLSHYRSADGRLFFGGVNGITSFMPDDFTQNVFDNLPATIVEVRSFNISKNRYDYQVQNGKKKDFYYLRPEDSFLEISLSTLEYNNYSNTNILWKIGSLQNDWIIQKDPVIRLSKLSYGDHVLEYTTSKSGNVVEGNTQSILIRVLKPFYLKPLFILMLCLLGLGLTLAISNWRTRILVRENDKLEQLVETRTFQVQQDKEVIIEQAENLRRMDEVKSRFFSNITHEFRTPLALMIGPLEMLLKGTMGTAESKDYLILIQRNAKKLLNLLEELLEFTKAEDKKSLPEYSDIPFLLFLQRKIAIFNGLARVKNIQLELDYRAEKDLVLRSDIGKWRKIISNLLDNAIKYTPSKGKVVLIFEATNTGYLLNVEDTGIGIEPTELPFIFDRFFRSNQVPANIGGTGIGLALCKEYCDSLGASIKVNSIPGKGSIFRITFEAEKVDVKSELQIESPEMKDSAIPIESKYTDSGLATVLLVEDEPDMLGFLSMILSPKYNTFAANNGQEALKILADNKVDLIVSDLMMPIMDGLEFLQKVKSINQMIPFILLTAKVGSEDKINALSLGVDDYLGKPFNPDELLVRVENLIERYRIRVEMLAKPNIAALEDENHERQWVRKLETVVRENLSNPDFTVLMLAENMNVSERALQYKTKSLLGLNPKQFILEIRLNEALRLLEIGTYPTVSEVCFAVGFKSTQYFSKVMKKRFGKSPSEYL